MGQSKPWSSLINAEVLPDGIAIQLDTGSEVVKIVKENIIQDKGRKAVYYAKHDS